MARSDYIAAKDLCARMTAAGEPRAAIAKACNVRPRTITSWRQDPALKAAIERYTSQAVDASALQTLRSLLLDPDSKVRLRAAELLLVHKAEAVPSLPAEEQPDGDPPPGFRRVVYVREDPIT